MIFFTDIRSAISFSIVFKRQIQGYFWQAYVPGFLLSIFGALSVYIPSDIVPGRMVLSMTSFLALIGLFGSLRYKLCIIIINIKQKLLNFYFQQNTKLLGV